MNQIRHNYYSLNLLYFCRWVPNVFSNQLDTEQNLEDTSATLSDGFLTVNFTRPIISPDKNQDLDLNTCQYVVYVFNGAVLGSFESPTGFNIPTGFGLFLMQLCLQNCQGILSIISMYIIYKLQCRFSICYYYYYANSY